jgi:hypothetical protein
MRPCLPGLLAALAACLATPALTAEPDYRTIHMEIDVAKPAREVWARIGDFCDISEWFDNFDCAIVSGDGGVGTVRALAGGRVHEVLVGMTELSHGYTLPTPPGQFNNLYHGYIEARPVTGGTSKILYTLMLDVSDKPDESAKQSELDRRRATFEGALRKMKQIAEGA